MIGCARGWVTTSKKSMLFLPWRPLILHGLVSAFVWAKPLHLLSLLKQLSLIKLDKRARKPWPSPYPASKSARSRTSMPMRAAARHWPVPFRDAPAR